MKSQFTRYVIIILILCFTEASAYSGEINRNDEFLHGYITSIIDRELAWERGSYRLEVKEAIATITLPETAIKQQKEVIERLRNIDNLQDVNIILVASIEEMTNGDTSITTKAYEVPAITSTTVPFLAGDHFYPLIADPKEPRFFASYRYYDTQVDTVNIFAVGFGENFGFYRRAGKRPGDGLQIGLSGGIFSQFNLDAPSLELINTDYVIGIPITFRRGPFSSRLRIYHQSSHLGDEYLLRAQPERVEVSYESLELILSYDCNNWRGYGGGEYIFRHSPDDLEPTARHAGIEYRGSTEILGIGRLIGGLDLKSYKEHDWSIDTSLKLGFEFGSPDPGRRHLRLMAEAYDGYSPHGQFYTDKISYYGIGLSLAF